MYTVILAYFDYYHIRKLNEHMAGFANINKQTKSKQIIDALVSLNLKMIYRKNDNDLLVYVVFEIEAALFNACSKFLYINNNRIKELLKGHDWDQRECFY